jgi:hypothetical protein
MDEELKALLNNAKASGASDNDLRSLITMYESDKNVKKKTISEPSLQKQYEESQPTVQEQNVESPTKPITQPISSGTQESYDLKTQKKSFSEPFDFEKKDDIPKLKTNDYKTKLNSDEESKFKEWYSKVSKYKNLSENPDSEGQFYDYRGFWKNEDKWRDEILGESTDAHFIDKYKQPGHPTFSDESKYSSKETQGGEWSKDAKGKWVFTHSDYTEKYSDRTNEYLDGTGEYAIFKMRKPESYDLKTQTKTPDFTEPFSVDKQGDLPIKIQKHKEEISVTRDLTNRFKSGGLTALAGVAGIDNFINKLTASIVLDKESLAELNKLPKEAREILLASGSPEQISRIQNSAEAQNFLTDKAEKLSEKTIQYEGNIVDDISNGDFKRASYRVIQGAVESLPSMVLALSPGGLATIGASTASQKQESQEREGADLGLKTVANSLINGTSEAFFEKYTQGIFEPIKKMALGNKEVAKEISENLVKTILKDIGIEGGSEGLTSITQDLSDKLVAGKDVSMLQILKNSIDASIIGGFVGGSMSGVKGYVSTKTRSAETTKKINENSAMSEALKKELGVVDSESIKNALQAKIEQVDGETAEIQKAEIAKVDNLSDEQVKNVLEVDGEMKKVNQSFIELVNDDKISPEVKKVLEKDLEQKFTALEAQKNEIVNPKVEETPNNTQEGTKTIETAEIIPEKVDNKANEEISPIEKGTYKNDSEVKYVHENNIELQETGTKEQYADYLETIFPNNKNKEILYHSGGEMYNEFDTHRKGVSIPSIGLNYWGSYFTAFKEYADSHGERNYKNPVTMSVVTDLKNPKIVNAHKSTMSNPFKFNYESINTKQLNKLKAEGYDGVIAKDANGKTVELVAFESNQIHILGSKKDIEGFKNYASNEKNQVAPIKEITNEKQTQGDITPNANIQPNVEQNIQQGQDEIIQPAIEPVADKGDVEVKEIDATTKALKDIIPENESFAFAINTLPIKGTINYKDIKQSDYALPFDRYINSPEKIDKEIGSAYKIYEFLKNGGELPNNVILLDKNGKILDGNNRVKAQLALGVTDFKYAVTDDKLFKQSNYKTVSEAYHKAKKDGSNPELVKAVESAIGKPTETPQPKSDKGDVEVKDNNIANQEKNINFDDIANFLDEEFNDIIANQEKPNKENGKQTKTTSKGNVSPEEGSVQKDSGIPEQAEEGKQLKKPSQRGKTPLDKRKIKDTEMLRALSVEANTPTDWVQQFFIGGGRMTASGLKEVIASKNYPTSEVVARSQYIRKDTKGGLPFNKIVHKLWEQYGKKLNISDEEIRNALIDVVNNFNTPKAMALDFNSRNNSEVANEQVNESGENLIDTPYGKMTESDLNDLILYEKLHNMNLADDEDIHTQSVSHLEQMTDAEIIEFAKNRKLSFDEFIKELDAKETKSESVDKNIGQKVFRGQQKGQTGKWFTTSKDFAGKFANSVKGKGKSDGEIIEHTITGKVFDFPFLVTEYAKISDKLGEMFGVSQQEIRDAIAITDESLSKSQTVRIHSLLENKGFQELLSSKGYDYIKAKENLTKDNAVDVFLQIKETTSNSKIYQETTYNWRTGKDETADVEVYHGTGKDFESYSTESYSGNTRFGKGISFTDGKGIAMKYSITRQNLEDDVKNDHKAIVKKAKLTISKPYDIRGTIDPNTPEAKKLIKILNERYGLSEQFVKNIIDGQIKDGKFGSISRAIFDPKTDESTFMFVGNTEKTRSIIEEAGYDSIIGEYEDANEYFVFDAKNVVPQDVKPTQKEKANAKIDKAAQYVKDLLPGVNDPNLKGQGYTQDQLIDFVAEKVKQLISAGIDVNEAIKQVLAKIKDKFGIELNPNDVKAKLDGEKPKVAPKVVEPKVEKDEFQRKAGKKSLLNRAFEGGNSKEITDAIERNGLDYRIENREIAKRNAENFVNEVGSENALQAVRDNKIKGAEKAYVYSKIISILVDEINANTNQEQRQELEAIHAKIIADITDEFGQETIEAGRFISALQDVYNSSSLKYNLTTQIDAHKALNNGVISDEVLAKLTEADKRIKELEKLITEAEVNLKKAEEAVLIKNIKDDIDKANKKDSKSKSALTKEETAEYNQIRRELFGVFNDITRVATLLADPKFRRYLQLAFKSVKGDFNNFSKQLLKELGKGVRKHLPQLFKEAGGKSDVSVTQLSTVKIGKKGNIVIPTQLFRDYVEQGETDIDVIAGLIKEDIADEFPDADIRDIRDAITGYGKRINPSRDEVQAEMSRLKIVGKLISAYEDALQGIRPLKSGLQRAKPTQQMREMRKEINRLIKEIGLSEADLEREWASALDRAKTQLKNQIEDLDKQIANGEKRKIERNPVKLDDEAKELRAIRDAKKKILDELVGKPELTEEELIARAEKSLELSIEKLQKEIASGEVEFKTRPDAKQSDKLTELRAQKKALTEIKNDMRAEAGLVEAQRMKTTKNRVKNQITELKRKIEAKEYAKKVVRPLREDAELLKLRAEKLLQQEIFDAQKYQDELKNRSLGRKFLDGLLEVWNIERILRATGELSTVLIQGGILTTSRKFTNPKELAKIMGKLFTAIGSAKKSDQMAAMIKAHPDYPLAMKAKLALANPDYKSDVREENYTGDYANFAWDLPFTLAGASKKGTKLSNIQKSVLGDIILNPFKRLTGLGKIGTDKVSTKQQWKNINPFRALERGSTLYMNTLRIEEFARGVEMLRMEGKNEIDHLQDYKLLANAINTMSGRANLPTALATNTQALSVIFFSAKNAIAVINQVNPIYYGYLHFASTDGAQFKKTSVANKLAMYNMMRFVTITGATLIALKFAAGKDDDDEDVATIETDPRSSDFMKLKIGNIRWDLFHGQMGVLVLMARLITEQVKSTKDGKVEDLADKRFGQQNRLDLVSSFGRNKLAPSASRLVNYFSTKEKLNPETGEMVRMTPFGKDYDDENSIANIKPMYWDAIKEIKNEDPGALAQFLTVVSAFGWNTGVYGGQTPMSKNELQILMSKRNPEYKEEKTKEEKAKTKTENAEKSKDDELFYRAEAARLGVEYIPLKVKIPANPNGQGRERRGQQDNRPKRGQ